MTKSIKDEINKEEISTSSSSLPTLADLKCKYCGMPQTGAYYTLSDGKSYVWHSDCLPKHNHEFQ
jgi:hypothetical protein